MAEQKRIPSYGTLNCKLEKLELSGPLWKTISSNSKPLEHDFDDLIKNLELEINFLEAYSCEFPKKFFSIFTSVFLKKLNSTKASIEDSSLPIRSVVERGMSDLAPYMCMLQYLLSKGGMRIEAELNVPVLNLLSSFRKRLTLETQLDGNEVVVEFVCISVQTVLSIASCLVAKKQKIDLELEQLTGIPELCTQNSQFEVWCSKPIRYMKKGFINSAFYPKIPCDIALYSVWGIVSLLSQLEAKQGVVSNSLLESFLNNTLSDFILTFLSHSEFINGVDSDCSKNDMEKGLLSLEAINCICQLLPKESMAGYYFIENHAEKIKCLFFYSTLLYSNNFLDGNEIVHFIKDNNFLAKFYQETFKLADKTLNKDLERLPVLIFSLIQQPEITKAINYKPPVLQLYTLQFLEVYLKLLSREDQKDSKFLYLKDVGLISLLFSETLFCMSPKPNRESTKLYQHANEKWTNIWKDLTSEPEDVEWVCSSLVNLLKFYNSNIDYSLRMNQWITSQAEEMPQIMKGCIKYGLVQEMLKILANLKKAGRNSDELVMIMTMVNSILKYGNLLEEESVTEIINHLLNEELIDDENITEFCMSSVSIILKNCKKPKPFKNFIAKLDKVDVIPKAIKYFNVIQTTILNSGRKARCQELFVLKAKALEQLSLKLSHFYKPRVYNFNDLGELWASVFENMRILIEDNPRCKKYLSDNINFIEIARKIQNSGNSQSASCICQNTLENLLFILCETNILSSDNLIVKNPEVIPLVMELIIQENSLHNYHQLVLEIVSDQVNAAHFATNGGVEILLKAFSRPVTPEVAGYLAEFIRRVVPHNISPQELQKLLALVSTPSVGQKELLFKSFCEAVESKSWNSSALTSEKFLMKNYPRVTSYFAFRDSNSYISYEGPDFMSKKEFSLFLWFYPFECQSTHFLLDFSNESSEPRQSFEVYIRKGKLLIECTGKRKFTIISSGDVVPMKWNLAGFSMKQSTKLMTKKTETIVFLNNHLLKEPKAQGSAYLPKENFTKLTIGNNKDRTFPFKGKILKVFLCDYYLVDHHFNQISSIPLDKDYCLNPCAVGSDNQLVFNKSILKQVFKSVYFELSPKYYEPHMPHSSAPVCEENVERFNGISAVDSISAIGGLRYFLPVVRQNKAFAHSLLECITYLASGPEFLKIGNEGFFAMLENTLSEVVGVVDKKLLELICGLQDSLKWNQDLMFRSLETLLLSERIWKNLSEELSCSYLQSLKEFVKKNMWKEDLPYVYKHLNTLNIPKTKEVTPYFLGVFESLFSSLEMDSYRGENSVLKLLILMQREKDPMLAEMLTVLKRHKEEKNSELLKDLLLEIFRERQNEPMIQAEIISILFPEKESLARIQKDKMTHRIQFESSPEKEAKEISDVQTFSFELDMCMGPQVFVESTQAVIDIVLRKTKNCSQPVREVFEGLLETVCKRIKESKDCKEILKSLLQNSRNHEELCIVMLNSSNFPDWILEIYYDDSESRYILDNLVVIVFSKTNKSFNKLRYYFERFLEVFKDFEKVLYLYGQIIRAVENKNGFKNYNLFLNFSGVLEDILSPDILERVTEFDSNTLKHVVLELVGVGRKYNYLFRTQPVLPKFSIQQLCNWHKERPNTCELNYTDMWLREGGFLRIVLKLLFISLQRIPSSKELIEGLKLVLRQGNTHGSYLTITNALKEEWEKGYDDRNTKRYTSIYSGFSGSDNMLYTQEFLCLYVVAECTEIIEGASQNYQRIASFLREFIQDTEADTKIRSVVHNLTSSELKSFQELLGNFQSHFHSTSRSFAMLEGRCVFKKLVEEEANESSLERRHFIGEIYSENDLLHTLSQFKETVGNMCNKLKSVINDNELFAKLLIGDSFTDPENKLWVQKVHFFLLAYTSMKMNFIWRAISNHRLPFMQSRNRPRRKFSEELNFRQKKDEIFESFKQDDERRKRKLTCWKQKFHEFLKIYQKEKNILLRQEPLSLKLRPRIDPKQRMPLLETMEKCVFPGTNRATFVSMPRLPTVDMAASVSSYLKDNNFELVEEESQYETEEVCSVDESEEELPNTLSVSQVRVDCERIKIQGSYFGKILVNDSEIHFHSSGELKPDCEEYFGSALQFTRVEKEYERIWNRSEVEEVFARRFQHLHTAFEIFLKNGKSVLFNVFNKGTRNQILGIMKKWKGLVVVSDLSEKALRKQTQKWREGNLSNFEYLMILNKYSSRSFNDMGQYPIFPWIVKDFSSDKLKLDNPEVFRDLRYPVGAQSEENRRELQKKFEMWKDDEIEAFHYGSHYSSGGVVSHYLVRLPPFTFQAKSLQGGQFDVPDRLFISIEGAWRSCVSPSGDVKELVPEMFYLPEMFVNLNSENFGKTQFGHAVNEVQLPVWAKSPYDFVRKHRKALESEYVSSNLNHWIDLIFGFKQKGQEAEKAFNKFYSITYEETITTIMSKEQDIMSLHPYIEQIAHFGQTPVQLFKNPHPKRNSKPKETPNFFERAQQKEYAVEEKQRKSYKNGVIVAMFINSQNLIGVKVTDSGKINLTVWKLRQKERIHLSEQKEVELEGTRYLDMNCWSEGSQWKYNIHKSLLETFEQGPNCYTFWQDTFIVSGFHTDNSFKLHKTDGTLQYSVYYHAALVTAVNSCQDLIFTGSLDTSITAWNSESLNARSLNPYKTYLGHKASIRQIEASHSYQILVSLDSEGVVLFHDVRSGELLKKLPEESSVPQILAFSSYGVVVAFANQAIKVYSVNAELIRSEFRTLDTDISCMCFSACEEHLIIGGDNCIACLDVFEESQNLPAHIRVEFTVRDIVTSPAQDFLVASLQNSELLMIGAYNKEQRETAQRFVQIIA